MDVKIKCEFYSSECKKETRKRKATSKMGGGGGTGEEKPAHRIILGAVPGQFPPFQFSVVSIFSIKSIEAHNCREMLVRARILLSDLLLNLISSITSQAWTSRFPTCKRKLS